MQYHSKREQVKERQLKKKKRKMEEELRSMLNLCEQQYEH